MHTIRSVHVARVADSCYFAAVGICDSTTQNIRRRERTYMKPFDPTKPCQYRNGKSCVILTTKGRAYDGTIPQPIVAEGETGITTIHTAQGQLLTYQESDYDLINIPSKKTVEMWFNVYDDGDFSCHASQYHANHYAPSKPLFARKKITFEVEEGEGL